MNFENKAARVMRNTSPARFFIPLGLILIVVGVILLFFNSSNYLETAGKVTNVSEVAAEEGVRYDVSFTYTVDGKELTSSFDGLPDKYGVGDSIKVFYDPSDPQKVTNTKMGGFIAPILIVVGAAAVVFGIFKTVKAFKKSAALDRSAPSASRVSFDGFKTSGGVTEYYFRFDGNSLKPGYIIEDADRKVLFEGKMLKNALVGARLFEFNDHVRGTAEEHEVGHTAASTVNEEFFSTSSWFKFDGKNVWDVLHGRGIRIATDMHSKFPYFIYDVSKNGEPFARVETTGVYVHEDDAEKHKINIPAGNMYYRFWTKSDDFDSLFLTIFAISETEQAVVE